MRPTGTGSHVSRMFVHSVDLHLDVCVPSGSTLSGFIDSIPFLSRTLPTDGEILFDCLCSITFSIELKVLREKTTEEISSSVFWV